MTSANANTNKIRFAKLCPIIDLAIAFICAYYAPDVANPVGPPFDWVPIA